MTCEIGSEDRSGTSSRDAGRRGRTAAPFRVQFDAPPEQPSLLVPEADRRVPVVAVMFSRVLFFALILAVIGASAAEDSGECAPSLRS